MIDDDRFYLSEANDSSLISLVPFILPLHAYRGSVFSRVAVHGTVKAIFNGAVIFFLLLTRDSDKSVFKSACIN